MQRSFVNDLLSKDLGFQAGSLNNRSLTYLFLLGFLLICMFSFKDGHPFLLFFLYSWVLQLITPRQMIWMHAVSLSVFYFLCDYFAFNGLHEVKTVSPLWVHVVFVLLLVIVSSMVFYCSVPFIRYIYRKIFFPDFCLEDFWSLKLFMQGEYLLIRDSKRSPSKFKTFLKEQCILDMLADKFGELVFKIPFKNIPLHINSNSEILKWRLYIGK